VRSYFCFWSPVWARNGCLQSSRLLRRFAIPKSSWLGLTQIGKSVILGRGEWEGIDQTSNHLHWIVVMTLVTLLVSIMTPGLPHGRPRSK